MTQTNFRREDALNFAETERKTEMESEEHPRVDGRTVTGPGVALDLKAPVK